MPSACDILPNETSQELASSKKSKQHKDKKNGTGPSSGKENSDLKDESVVGVNQSSDKNDKDDDKNVDKNVDKNGTSNDEASDKAKTDQELIFIHDTGFTIKVSAPGVETFDLQVSSMELVQEIHHLLMDREDTCSRTCFSLSLNGNTLDNFAELKSIDGFKEGAIIKIVEEPYTVREARIHIRHIRDLLKSLDPADAYNGQECNSLSFLHTIAQGDILDQNKKKNGRLESSNNNVIVDCTPPNYILPGHQDLPLSALQPISKEQKGPQALKILTTSGWNAPPGNRKLHGDLIYIYVVTMEDKHFHITSSTKGFYVNLSTNEEFNPKPASPFIIFHSLIDLISHLSPIFKKNYAFIQKKRHRKHPFERVATPYQLTTWTSPKLEHSIDSIRAEDSFASKLGYEEHLPGQTRDWNDELQTTRELPRKTLPDRLIRERAIFKVHSDFVVAATRGAMAVIDGNVLAINPSENQKMQMFIWHNIFFSLGFDIRDHYKDLGGDYAAFVAPNNDLQGVKAYATVDVEGLFTLGTVVIDYRGFRVTAQSIIPGILEREQEQSVVYGSIDFGKTVITNEKYLELLGKAGKILKILPHKVYDHNDELVELVSSVECKGIIGNDGRHYILDLLRTFPQDVNYYPLPIEEYSKEVIEQGYPKKFKHNLCCLRQELIDTFFEYRYMSFIKNNAIQSCLQKASSKDENSNDAPAVEMKKETETEKELKSSEVSDELSMLNNLMQDCKFKDLNGELKKLENKIISAKEDEDGFLNNAPKEIIKTSAKLVGSLKDDDFYIRFNPNAFSPIVRHDETDKEYFNRQTNLIKDAATFLVTLQIPVFISDCLQNVLQPIDGFALSEALHNRGINIRYLGKIAEKLSQFERLQYLHSITVTELICRSAKHLFVSYIQNVDTVNSASALNLFLNCFLSACKNVSIFNVVAAQQATSISQQTGKKKNRKRNKHHISTDSDLTEWATLTPKTFLDKLKDDLQQHYSFTLDGSTIEEVVSIYKLKKISILRSFCLKTGLQILLRDYKFDLDNAATFNEDDILNIFPVVKHIQPKATDALNFFSTGQNKIQRGQFKEGYELINEALNLLNNVYGALHPEITQCLRMLARLNYIMGDFVEAMACQQKAVLMSEKVNGIDHSITITEYTHLALYCFANQQVTVALKMLYRARYLLLLNSSENHPDMALIDSNIGLILHSVGEYEMSIQFLKSALNLNIFYYGNDSLKVAVSYDLVARSQSCLGDFRSALHNEKETYSIYKQQLGEKHEKSIESSESLRHLTQQAVVLQKRMNELSKGKNATVPSLQIQPPSLNSVLQTLNIINGIINIQFTTASNLNKVKESNKIEESKMIDDSTLD